MLLSVEESVRTRYRSGVTASAEVRLQREMTHDADTFEPSADELIAHNRDFADTFADHDLQVSPTRNLAVVACMDSRMTSSSCSVSAMARHTSSATRAA